MADEHYDHQEARRLKSEMEALRKEIITLIEANDRRYEERHDFELKAADLAKADIEERLHTYNNFRQTYAEQSQKFITRTELDGVRGILDEKLEQKLTAVFTRIEGEVKPINTRLADMGKPNWMLAVALMSVVFGIVAGGWLVVGLKIESALAPVAQSADQSRINLASINSAIGSMSIDVRASTAADSNSKADRAQLNDRLGKLEIVVSNGQGDRRAGQAALEQKLIEVETQFKALSNARNEMLDQTERSIGMLWYRVYKERYPPTNFRANFYKEHTN